MPEIYYSDSAVTLYHADCLDALRELPDASVDAVVTDPPAGISFMGKTWDHNKGGREQWSAWLAEVMREAYRVAKPGAHALVWALPRTSHWTACGLEDAGWEIRDRIAHHFGSGFPKSLAVDKAIDARAKVNEETKRRTALVAEVIRNHREAKGMERAAVSMAVVGTPSGACWNWEHQQLPSVEMWPAIKRTLGIPDDFDGLIDGDRAQFIAAERAVLAQRSVPIGHAFAGSTYGGDSSSKVTDITAPATPEAERWQGWGTALKPATEDWWLARKPLSGTVAANVTQWGTGALNVDGCRVGAPGRSPSASGWTAPANGDFLGVGESVYNPSPAGRWPANVVLDEHQARALDQMSGECRSAGQYTKGSVGVGAKEGAASIPIDGLTSATYDDLGGASRFFFIAREDGLAERFRYVAKAPTEERPRVNGIAHPTTKPLALMRWLVRLVTPPGGPDGQPGVVLDPFAGSGTTVEACILEGFRCIAVEREADYLPLIMQRIHRRRDPVQAVRGAGEDGGLFDLLDGSAS